MNAPLPQSATSQQNQAASSERGIDRLFSEMAAMYGTKFADLWAGADIEEVKNKWIEKLKGFAGHPGVIQKAIDAMDVRPLPPTLPEFLGLCRDAAKRMGTVVPALTHEPTAEERQRSRDAADAVARALKSKSTDGINTHWATHPRSEMHLKFIFDAAKRDRRFRPCVDQMIDQGICTEDGHLLKTYRDQQWWPVVCRAA